VAESLFLPDRRVLRIEGSFFLSFSDPSGTREISLDSLFFRVEFGLFPTV